MKRIKLIVAYDGTNYAGWQRQPNALTVEEVMSTSLRSIFQTEVPIWGASRTDAGVHAKGQVVLIELEKDMTIAKLIPALNAYLPDDIAVLDAEEVGEDFHPRFSAKAKTYEYKIYNGRYRMPQERLYSHMERRNIDVTRMQEAANYLIGEHDFKSFCSIKNQSNTTIRTIYDISITKEGDMISVFVTGSAFLYNMVRIIVGTLIEVGIGKFEPYRVKEILELKDRTKARKTAPARGLTLIEISYKKA